MKIAAAADPVDERLDYIAVNHNLPKTSCFTDWKSLLNSGLKADGVIISTGDRDHPAPASLFLGQGMHVLLEKPMAVEKEDLFTILKASREARLKGEVSRYAMYLDTAPFSERLKRSSIPVSLERFKACTMLRISPIIIMPIPT